nr:hypothetical protein [Tanacetum cinerariifolium]
MSAVANTTPIVTTITKPATNPRYADATPRVNIKDFCEEYYEDILPIIMDKTTRPERLKVRDRLRYGDRHVLDRLGHRRQSAFDQLSETYSPSTTKSRPGKTNCRDHPRGKSRLHRLDAFNEGFPEDRERFRGVGESYDDSYSRSYHDRDRSRYMKRKRDNESPLSSVSKSDSSDGRFTPLTRTPKEILAFEAGKFQSPPPMVTPVEKRSSNKFCDFHNDKRHSTDECMQLKKHIEELVRAGKPSHLIKEIKHRRDQSKVGKKEIPAKDKPAAIYMKQSWQRMTRQKVTQSFERVREITFLPLTTSSGAEGPLVIEAEIGVHMIHRMYVDRGSSMEILYEHCFNLLWPEVKNQMVPVTTSLTVFSGETIWPLGQLRPFVTIGDANHSTRAWMNFMIPSNMTGVPRSVAEHRLNIQEGYSPVRQKKKGQAPKRAKAIQAEVQKLVEAWIIREISYHEWLSSPVMVKKHDGSWRMCVDFTDLNKACPHDCYPLLEIDWKVKSLCGYPFKCFFELTKAITRYSWQRQMKRKRLSTPAKGCTATQKCLSASRTLAPRTSDCGQSFHQPNWSEHRNHLSELPLLVAPKPKEELIVYLSASYGAISVVLTTERGVVQTPIYFVSRALQGPKLNYTPMEKLVQSLVFAAKRLWSVMLGEHNITYRLRTSMKGQVLADFLAELSDESPSATSVVENQEPWTLFTDGSSCVDGSASNNEAEYEALIAGLRIAVQLGVQNVHVSVDSKMVANQVLGTYVAKEENMVKYLKKVKSLVLVEILKEKSIQEKEVTTVVEEDGPTWMTPIMKYLKEGTLPSDRKEARKLHIKARQEIHEGSCSMHTGPRSVVSKAIRLGYYWPTMHRDAPDMIRTCNNCQIHRPVTRNPRQPLTPITAPWPFYKWGIDIAGPFPEGPEQTEAWGEGIKALLGERNKNWVEELPHVLWAHRTMIKSSHGDTPFSLTYGTEAITPAEIEMPTYRTAAVDIVYNDEELRLNLDLLEERRKRAAIREAKAKLKMTKYYNARVRGVTFKPGDFVYCSNDATHAMDGGTRTEMGRTLRGNRSTRRWSI